MVLPDTADHRVMTSRLRNHLEVRETTTNKQGEILKNLKSYVILSYGISKMTHNFRFTDVPKTVTPLNGWSIPILISKNIYL